MSKVTVNTNEASERPDLAEGDYECKIESIELRDGDKAQYLAVELVVSEGPHEGSLKFYDNITLSENAKWKAAGFFKAAGAPPSDGDQELDTEEFVGRPIIAHCEFEAYEDKKFLRPKYYKMASIIEEWMEKEFGVKPKAEAPKAEAPKAPTASEAPKSRVSI